jgi:hypothetical protein
MEPWNRYFVAENCGERSAESPNYNHTGAPLFVDIMSKVGDKRRVAIRKSCALQQKNVQLSDASG